MPIKTISLSVIALLSACQPAQSQQLCTIASDILKVLGEEYHENSWAHFMAGKVRHEIFVSEKGTVTIVAFYPNGIACLLAAGRGFTPTGKKSGQPT